MTVRVKAQRLFLDGICGAEEADILFSTLVENPTLTVDLTQAERLHTSLWQILLMLRPTISGKPKDSFSANWLAPAVAVHDRKT